ncbi:GIY-YIG catalytic domain-containing endonuclease [Paramecium bursaria Chlorella virus CviKI]|nr:GIY-YIG catalytic domain-containing endonuclease [Paramecium bursaria Chlorella virus CviKI]
MGFIYTLTSPSRKEYVGQTTRSIEQRLDEHQKEYSVCKAIAGAIRKHGWDNFIVDYYECPDDELNKHETWLIRLMGTLSPNGYNLREGGGRGKMSEETKKKMSVSKQDKNHPMFGKIHTEKTKKNMIKNSPNSKIVYQFNLDGTYLQMFGSCRQAAEYIGKPHTNIARCARGKQKKAYGFRWSYTSILD